MKRESFRSAAQALETALADAGICVDLGGKTPAEIRQTVCAYRRRLEREATYLWALGQYAAIALRAPARYPPKPARGMIHAMSDEAMKTVLKDIAERRTNNDD